MDESSDDRGRTSLVPPARTGPRQDSGPVPNGLAATTEAEIAALLAEMVTAPSYPCVGARSVFRRGNTKLVVLDRLAERSATATLLDELIRFSDEHPAVSSTEGLDFASFIAAFRAPIPGSEAEFEDLLWRQLVLLHELDGAPWDETVSDDPASPHFGFSVAGRAFFVIGMHPGASRIARRTPLPVLVFNLHSQFDHLRASGQYERMRDTIRRRDTDLQGCPNPMLADHGARSEARQYSGRAVGEDWLPPYDFDQTSSEGDQA